MRRNELLSTFYQTGSQVDCLVIDALKPKQAEEEISDGTQFGFYQHRYYRKCFAVYAYIVTNYITLYFINN
jgi:proline dehydrogenase